MGTYRMEVLFPDGTVRHGFYGTVGDTPFPNLYDLAPDRDESLGDKYHAFERNEAVQVWCWVDCAFGTLWRGWATTTALAPECGWLDLEDDAFMESDVPPWRVATPGGAQISTIPNRTVSYSEGRGD